MALEWRRSITSVKINAQCATLQPSPRVAVRIARYCRRTVTEAQSIEVEKALLYIGDARARTRAAAERVGKAESQQHVARALREAERELGELHRRLTQQTFYAVDTEARLAV